MRTIVVRKAALRAMIVWTFIGLALTPRLGHAKPTTADLARTAVQGWLDLDYQPLGSRIGTWIDDVETVTDKTGRPLYHVVKLAPEGFVIVAGDDLVEPIVAFQPKGEYDPSPEKPLGALIAGDVPKRIVKAMEEQTNDAATLDARQAQPGLAFLTDDATTPGISESSRRSQQKWKSLSDTRPKAVRTPLAMGAAPVTAGAGTISDIRVSPLLQSAWGQAQVAGKNVYNYYTPNNSVSGCVATAMSQLMRYHGYPTVGVGTASYAIYVNGVSQTKSLRGGNGAGGAYAWSSMPLAPNSAITLAQQQAIGSLLQDAGVAVHMQYTLNSSGAYMANVIPALKNVFKYGNAKFGLNGNYANMPTAPRDQMINSNLDANLPVLLSITGSGGHAIVADGYGYNASTMYHHLNMGWDGYSDLWYNLPNIGTSYAFNVIDSVTYNVYPSGTGEIISGRVTDTGGNPLSGVVVTAAKAGGGSYTATTNAKGIYALVKLPSSSNYVVSASKLGYVFTSKNIALGVSTDNTTTTGNLWGADFSDSSSGNIAPIGTVSGFFPTYTWPATPNATHYLLYAYSSAGAVINKLFAAADICSNGTCTVESPIGQKPNTYLWKLRTYNPSGYGPWSAARAYAVVGPAAPAAAAPTSPTGTIGGFLPTYSWGDVSGATQYNLYVTGPGGVYVNKWYSTDDYCSNGTCTAVAPLPQRSGAYAWKLRAYNPSGYAAWSTAASYSIPVQAVPAAASPTSPTGAISDFTPAYSWPAVSGATHYALYVLGPGNAVYINTLYKASDICTSGTCTVEAPNGQKPGNYSWKVRTYNPSGYGPWSSTLTYAEAPASAPSAVTPTAPTGSGTSFFPTYSWTDTGDSTIYNLYVTGPSGVIINKTYKAADICSGGTCSVVSPAAHRTASYSWKVRGYNPVGYGAYSSPMAYSVTVPAAPVAAW